MADKYMRMIDNAKSGAELREIENDIQADKSLDIQVKCDLVGYSSERRMYDFGELLNM